MTRVPIADFEDRYRRDSDPWQFATSSYEQRRYDVTIACLPAQHYERAFEPGCAIGELTARLSLRCDQIEASDGSPTVVAAARRRLAHLRNVTLAVASIPDDWPEGSFDLIMLSEIGYYFDETELGIIAGRARQSLRSSGVLMAVHWLGSSPDHVLHGDDVHPVLEHGSGLDHTGRFRDAGFRLDWWTKS